MGHEFINDVLHPIAVFGGIALIIWTSAKARFMHRLQDMKERQPTFVTPPQSDAVLQEVKALSAKVGEMQSTSHGFDLAFDAALERMEQRVARLETKAAASVADMPPAVQRNGLTGE